MKTVLLLAGLLLGMPGATGAEELPWESMQKVGEARLTFLLWPVYDAHLFSASGEYAYPDTLPFALSLEYQRDFSGDDLVSETRRQWQALEVTINTSWLTQLATILPDVSKGDTITLYVDAAGKSTFYFNDRKSGTIADAGFSRQFAAIWLSHKTTRAQFRDRLLGVN